MAALPPEVPEDAARVGGSRRILGQHSLYESAELVVALFEPIHVRLGLRVGLHEMWPCLAHELEQVVLGHSATLPS
jgi:hypothetical protein